MKKCEYDFAQNFSKTPGCNLKERFRNFALLEKGAKYAK